MSVSEQLLVLGVHPVEEAPDPCYLVELRVGPGLPALDLTAITQPTSGLPGNGWQAPVDAHLLDPDGASGQPLDPGAARAVPAPARLAFFFHFLQLDRPLLTPIGPLQLPAPTPRPPRLAFLRYTT
jgi:hypothetical protein